MASPTELFQATIPQVMRVASMPDSDTKTGLIQASEETIDEWFAGGEITAEQRRQLLDLLRR
jgi:uncharacterized membrane protein